MADLKAPPVGAATHRRSRCLEVGFRDFDEVRRERPLDADRDRPAAGAARRSRREEPGPEWPTTIPVSPL